jgi:hypothetical protein
MYTMPLYSSIHLPLCPLYLLYKPHWPDSGQSVSDLLLGGVGGRGTSWEKGKFRFLKICVANSFIVSRDVSQFRYFALTFHFTCFANNKEAKRVKRVNHYAKRPPVLLVFLLREKVKTVLTKTLCNGQCKLSLGQYKGSG